ncbi:zf-TFIIB domain-containing protein, partial [Spirochaetota bacterium]
IKCRECEDMTMKKINFLDYSDIIMDYCSSCGSMWLDKDELSNMHNYIKKVEEGSHESKNPKGFDLLVKLNEIAYSIFH